MIKAASLSIGLVFLLAGATASWSQTSPSKTAVDEAIRRQGNMMNLKTRLAEASAAEGRRDLQAASTQYEAAMELVYQIGDVDLVRADAEQARQGLAAVKLELAVQAQRRHDYLEAQTLLDRVVKVDPTNERARKLSAENQKILEEKRVYYPTPDMVDLIKETGTNRVNAKVLVQNAKVLMEANKLDEAERTLQEAIKLSPQDVAANSYLFQIMEMRYQEAARRRERDSREGIVEVQEGWAKPVKSPLLPVPNPYVTNKLIHTGPGRQTIMEKLNRIRIDTVQYEGLGLGEVIRNLNEDVKKRDPGGKGINFLVNPNADFPAGGTAPVIDPTTGLAIPAPPAEAVDINSIAIKLSTPLNDLRLADVLDAIVKVAEKPIKYTVGEYAVEFSLRGPENPPLYIRNFRVNPNTFYQGLESVTGVTFGDVGTTGGQGGGGQGGGGQGGQGNTETGAVVPRVSVTGVSSGQGGGQQGGGQQGQGGLRSLTRTNAMESVSAAVRNYFTTLGVDLGSQQAIAQGKAVFWNDRLGELLVRATSQDLDMIESAIQALNREPPQVNVRTKFLEVTQEDTRGIGMDWYLGGIRMGGNRIISSGGTQPSLSGAPSFANPEGTFPGSALFGTTQVPATSDGNITPGLRNALNLPAVASMTGILTDPQFKAVLRLLDQRTGVDLLSEPEVTTVSGRQAQVQVVDVRYIVTGTQNNSGGGQLGTPTAAGGGVVQQANAPIFQTPNTQPISIGPVLDVIPYVNADGFTIQMTLIPTITEFVGYDDPGPFIPQALSGGGTPLTTVLPLPRFRVRTVTTSAIVWDGQTMVLGGLISEDVQKFKDKVPGLGDLPIVGKLFRSESTQTRKKNLVIFVTPTILDPAGNKVHNEEDLPFAQATVPVQSR